MQLQRSNGMHVLRKPLSTSVPATPCRGKPRDARCRAYEPDSPFRRRLMFLPGGAWFMSSCDTEAPVYGDSFVMHSPAPAGRLEQQVQGLVPLQRRPLGVAVRQPQQSREIVPLSLEDIEVSIVVLPVEESTGIVPFRQMLQEANTDTGIAAPEPNSSCLAIVPKDNTMLGVVMGSAIRRRDDDVQLPMSDDTVYETFNTKHPRRTMKIKFKCQRCGATTIKPINPHAWTAGTVFAKCGRCNITHKLIDNLKLFHELAGPVFNTPIQPSMPLPGSSSSSSSGGPLGDIQYDANGLPVLPERLQLRLNQWQAPQDFPDDTSNYN